MKEIKVVLFVFFIHTLSVNAQEIDAKIQIEFVDSKGINKETEFNERKKKYIGEKETKNKFVSTVNSLIRNKPDIKNGGGGNANKTNKKRRRHRKTKRPRKINNRKTLRAQKRKRKNTRRRG